MKLKPSKKWIIILALVVIKLALHFATNTHYDLHRDAFLYYALGEHLDWGYVSVPPFIAVMSRISVFLFGNTVFALRFFPAIIGGISVIIIAKMVMELEGGIWAIILACLAYILSPAFLRSNTLFQPVSFNQFFWLLSGYLTVLLLKRENPKIWIAIFVVFGIAFLNKYSITFFIVSFLIGLILTPNRRLFFSKYLFIGGAIGIIMILPNLVWQYIHNWPLVNHMAELQRNQFVNVTITGFIIDQFIMNLPGLLIWIIGLIVFLFYKKEKEYRVLAYIYLFTVMTIIIFRGKSYYTLGLYPILFAMGGYAIESYGRKYMRYIAIPLIFLFSIPMMPLSLPIYNFEKVEEITQRTAPFTNRWEDGTIHNLPQDYADMTGWKELSGIVIDIYESLPQEIEKNCVIYAEEYGEAGAIMFYGKKHGLQDPICFNDNFLLWAPDSIKPEVFIYVNHEVGDIEWLFQNYELVYQINNKYFRENGLQVYRCTQPYDTLNTFYDYKVKELKGRYENNK